MLNRVTSLLIGKDISRDAQVVASAQLDTITKSTGLADGEIVVLDKNKTVLAAGATVADSDTIYIVQSTSDTFDYTNKAGTAVTGNRRIIMSGPIVASKIKNYSGKAYSAKSEQATTLDFTGITPVVGTEYLIRIVYKDIKEHPGQFTQTYRYISTTATLADFVDNFVAKINAHSGRRVTASNSSDVGITLTGREIPQGTTALTDIDEYKQVEFEAFANYIDSDDAWATLEGSTGHSTTVASRGSGEWEQVRDLEKSVRGYRGISNLTHFPVITPDFETVKDATYNMVVIEHDVPYQSPDNQYVKNAPQTTVIAIPVESSGTQMTSVLAQLNPWMASSPGAFSSVSF